MKAPLKLRIPAILLAALLLLSIISLSCNLPAGLQERFQGLVSSATPTIQPTNTPQPLPPTVVETDPPQGSSLGVGKPITVYFNQDMDPASVEEAFSSDPDLGGSLEWEDPSILRFIPGGDFPAGAVVNLSFSTAAKAANGLSLPAALYLTYYTPDDLEVVTVLPQADGIAVDPLSAILVSFNQPVVSLGGSSGEAPAAFSVTPAVAGSGEWINTSTYQFSPAPGLPGGTTFQVVLSSGLTSTAGTPLSSQGRRSWSFSTAYPEVIGWEPHEGDIGVPIDKTIRLTFNQAMDRDSVEEHFSLIGPDGANVPGSWTWSEDAQEAEFLAGALLQRGATYAAVLPGEATSAGGTALGVDTRLSFQTTGEFQFLGTPSGQSYSPSIYEGATLYFNNPVDLDTVEDNIAFIPEITNFWPSTGGSGSVLNIYGDFEPLTEYLLVMREGLADTWGSQMGNAYSIKFTTAALSPNLTVTQGNNILFLTGSENAIPVQGTSVYQVAINMGTIPVDAIPKFFGPGYYTALDEYYPPDVRYWNEVLNLPGDDVYTVNLPLNQSRSALAPGLYRYQIYSQELPYNPSPYLLAVSDLHLTMKTSPENILIWALDLRTGEAAAGTDISVYDQTGQELFQGATNADGIFQADFPEPLDLYNNVFYAIANEPGQPDFGITASNWAFGTEAYNFGLPSNYGAPQPQTYIYTDRPIYRPGQTVNYRLVHREPLEGGYQLPREGSITLSIYQAGKDEQQVTLQLSDYGTASGSLELSSQAQPGYYRLETDYGMTLFEVAEYRKPEIELTIAMDRGQGLVGEDWQAQTQARYYFDAPAAEVDLSWSLRAQAAPFYLPGYQVGMIDSDWIAYTGIYSPFGWGTRMDEGQAQTDQAGFWELEGQLSSIDMVDREVTLPANYILSVTAQDESGFQVTGESSLLVHPSSFYIGVHPSAWVAEAGEQVDFDLLVVDWDKLPDGIHALTAEFSKVTWNHEVGDFGQIEYTRQEELISTQGISTNQQGEAVFSLVPDEPGTYQLDVFGDGARTQVSLWVGGAGTITWPTLTNQKIKLVADREEYQPGDTASVFIPNPFPEGAQALVTIERQKVLWYETVSISGSGQMIEIELDESDAPNVYLSVTLIGNEPEGTISFRQGYLNLLVDPGDKILNVELVGDPEKLGPGEEVSFTIRVTDQDGIPVQGEFSLAVVDEAVLALADPYADNIGEVFYGTKPLAVRMGLPLGMHAGLLVFIPGGMGGGGGDVDNSVRDQFEDTGFWQADIQTDQDGLAVVSVVLPDNLTTWQADTRGVTVDTEVGQAGAEVITTKDLLVRPVTPRFLVAGDHLALAALVHNNTAAALAVEVSLQGSGLTLDIPESAAQSVEIPAGGRTRVEWWATVEDVDQADLLFQAEGEGYRDAVKPYNGPLPVMRYLAPVVFGTSGLLDQAGQELEIVSLPRSFDPTAGSLEIELSPSLAAALLKALAALEQREVYSNEAALSGFLPNVVTYQTLRELDLDYAQLEGRLDWMIPETLDALEAAQNEDGGWGWWRGGASDPEISCYILFGLIQAQNAGLFVDELMVQNGTGYLMATLPALDMLTEARQYDLQALRYFVLTEAGINVRAGSEALADLASQLTPGHQALLALALDASQPGHPRAASLLSNLAGSGIRTATGLHWENPDDGYSWLDNDGTTSAMVVYALARAEGAPEVLPEAVRYLVSLRTSWGDWWSPYQTSWSILALNEVLKTSGELDSAYGFSAAVNGRELISGQAEGPGSLEAAAASLPVRDLYNADPNALVVSRTDGSGSLYYKAHLLVYRPAGDVQPYGRGLSISRVYSTVPASGEAAFTQSGKVGDLIKVQVTLTLENDTHYLMIEDHFPAGAEVLDTRLKTSRQDLGGYLSSSPFQEGWGWWFFNDPRVYDDRINWSASYLPAGTYQITYILSLTHPGEYQVLPAQAWQIYFPETAGISAGDVFAVQP